jgi:hypothetical protein
LRSSKRRGTGIVVERLPGVPCYQRRLSGLKPDARITIFRQGQIEVSLGAAEIAFGTKQAGQGQVAVGQVCVQRQRLVQGNNGLVVTLQRLQRQAAIAVSRGEAGAQADRPVIGGNSRGQVAAAFQCVTQVDVKLGNSGRLGDGLANHGHGIGI